jgi:hypothetical protein
MGGCMGASSLSGGSRINRRQIETGDLYFLMGNNFLYRKIMTISISLIFSLEKPSKETLKNLAEIWMKE